MKLHLRTIIIFSAVCCNIAAFACTNFIAGRKATTDGSVMVTYADDSYTRFRLPFPLSARQARARYYAAGDRLG